PLMSRLEDNTEALERIANRIIYLNLLVLGVGYALAAGLAPTIVPIIFGDQWSAMIPVFQALCVGGVFKALNQVNFWMFLSTDNTGAQFRLALWAQPLIVLCMAMGLSFGAVGVAIGHSVG